MFVPFLQLVGCVSSPFLSSFVLSVAEIQPSCFRKSPFLKFGKPSISIGHLDHGYVKSPEGYLFFLFTLSNPQNPPKRRNEHQKPWMIPGWSCWMIRWSKPAQISRSCSVGWGHHHRYRKHPEQRRANGWVDPHHGVAMHTAIYSFIKTWFSHQEWLEVGHLGIFPDCVLAVHRHADQYPEWHPSLIIWERSCAKNLIMMKTTHLVIEHSYGKSPIYIHV